MMLVETFWTCFLTSMLWYFSKFVFVYIQHISSWVSGGVFVLIWLDVHWHRCAMVLLLFSTFWVAQWSKGKFWSSWWSFTCIQYQYKCNVVYSSVDGRYYVKMVGLAGVGGVFFRGFIGGFHSITGH